MSKLSYSPSVTHRPVGESMLKEVAEEEVGPYEYSGAEEESEGESGVMAGGFYQVVRHPLQGSGD